MKQVHKAGFVNIIGSPNVGKSTLMNQLVGEQLSIITPKAQTTRHRILGIVNEKDYQIVYSDTPGLIAPSYKMQEGMMKFVYTSLQDADIVVVMLESGQKELRDRKLKDFLNSTELPIIVLINKIDLSQQSQVEEEVQFWKDQYEKAIVLPISALHGFNIDTLTKCFIDLLPESPPYYPKDTLTDKNERFFVEEKIREKALLNYGQEIPYSIEVVVDTFKETKEIIKIRTLIFTARESQKVILIGKGGSKLKKVGREARIDLEKFFNKKIFLELFVKVKKDWRNDENQLKRFGYL